MRLDRKDSYNPKIHDDTVSERERDSRVDKFNQSFRNGFILHFLILFSERGRRCGKGKVE